MDEIVALGQIFKNVTDSLTSITTFIKSARNEAVPDEFVDKLNTELIEMQKSVLSAQSCAIAAQESQSALVESERNLKAIVARYENWDREKDRYMLSKIGHGCFAYRLREEFIQDSNPVHHLCVNCFENGEKSILQYTGLIRGKPSLHCPRCKTQVRCSSDRI